MHARWRHDGARNPFDPDEWTTQDPGPDLTRAAEKLEVQIEAAERALARVDKVRGILEDLRKQKELVRAALAVRQHKAEGA